MNQNSLFLILAAPACAWVAGMGLFKTLLLMTAMHRWIDGGQFDGPLGQLLGADWFLYFILTLGAVEIIVDMVPRWDIVWHKWNGHLRIIGAVALSWFVLSNEDVVSRVIMSFVGAMLAVTSYTATTSARKAAIRGGTQGFVAPISSVTENCLIVACLMPLVTLPPMTMLLLAFMIGASMLVIYVVRREARETFQWLFSGRWIKPVAMDTSGAGSEEL